MWGERVNMTSCRLPPIDLEGWRRGALVLLMFLVVCAAVPLVDATETKRSRADDDVSAEKAGETNQKEEKDEKADGEKKGPPFIAIPIFITEPAIGYGLGGAVGYFHKKKHATESGKESHPPAFTAETAANVGKHQKVPPTITGFGGAYTENGTWGAALAHTASWKKDKIRYTGAIGYAHVVSTVYLGDQPYDFKLDTVLYVVMGHKW